MRVFFERWSFLSEKREEVDLEEEEALFVSLFFSHRRTSAMAARPRGPCWMRNPAASSETKKTEKKEKRKRTLRPRVVRAPSAAEEKVEVEAAAAAMMAALLQLPPAPACPPRSCCSLRLPARLGQRRVET